MISATDAKSLYTVPPFTEEEVEAQIRDAATRRSWTCFDFTRLSEETRTQLRDNGFQVRFNGGSDYLVSWEESETKAA